MSDIKTSFHYDATANKEIICREQDISPIIKEIEDIKQISDGRGNTGMGYFAGRIPGIIIEKYMKQVGVTFHEFCTDDTHIHRILKDPDYKKFRVFEGNI